MLMPASPYVVFRAKDNLSIAAQPIGIGQCLRIFPKKYNRKNEVSNNKNARVTKKKRTNRHIQLTFV